MNLQPIPSLDWHRVVGYRRAFFGDRLQNLVRLGHAAGDIGQFTLPGQHVVIVNAPDYLDEILVRQADAFPKSTAIVPREQSLFGNGLSASEGEVHRRQRKLMAPAFQARRIAAYAETMAAYAERLQSAWPEGATIDIGREMTRLSLGIIGRTLFDREVDERDTLAQAHGTLYRFAANQLRAPARVLLARKVTPMQQVGRAVKQLDDLIYGLIRERRRSQADRDDLLTSLMEARYEDDGSRMADDQVRDEVMTLLAAGHDTVLSALTWAWYLLALHPDIYARLREEADSVLGGRTPEFADLPYLPYALQVFKEAMRLYPPVCPISRLAMRDVEVGGYHIPQGAAIWINPYVIHRSPEYFPSPEHFDPDRFAADTERARPRHAYLPFGGGPRLCIGNHFALMEGQLTLATLAQRVQFTLQPGQRVEPQLLVNLRPSRPIRLVVSRLGKRAPVASGDREREAVPV